MPFPFPRRSTNAKTAGDPLDALLELVNEASDALTVMVEGQRLLLEQGALPNDPESMAALKLLGITLGEEVAGFGGLSKVVLSDGWVMEQCEFLVGIGRANEPHRAHVGCKILPGNTVRAKVELLPRYEVGIGILAEGYGLAVGYVVDHRDREVPFYAVERGLSDEIALELVRGSLEDRLNTERPGWDDPATGYGWE